MSDALNTFLKKIQTQEIHIVGISGSEGAAIAHFLIQYGISRIVAHDMNEGETFAQSFLRSHVALPKATRQKALEHLKALPMTFCLGSKYLSRIEQAELIFIGQNWFNHPENFPAIPKAIERGVLLSSIMELYFELVPCPIVGVTGSVGKSTTCGLLHEMLKRGSKTVYYTGNDRYAPQLLSHIASMTPDDLLLLEISNRHLLRLAASPHIAVLTNIYPNHIEEHDSFEAYQAVKKRIFKYQTPNDHAVLNLDLPICREIPVLGRRYGFSKQPLCPDDGEGVWIERDFADEPGKIVIRRDGKERMICDLSLSQLKGSHNEENLMAAVLAADLAGLKEDQIQAGVLAFKGLKNRIEEIGQINGMTFVNDLQSTTPSATLAALRTFEGKKIALIVGGHDKDLLYGELAEKIRSSQIYLILLPGSASDRLKNELTPYDRMIEADTLEQAVYAAKDVLPQIVLLSPAASHFYTRFVEGKKGFNALVRELEQHENGNGNGSRPS